jgi:cytoskeleton protein RodZ
MTQENENATQESGSSSSGPGRRLREAREAHKLTPQQAATQLRMQLRIIEALESDDYSGLPGATFVQGYLRSYARLLGLPEESILGLAQPGQGGEPELVSSIYEGEVEASSGDLPFRLISFLILIAVVIGVGWWFSQQVPSSEVTQSQPPLSDTGEQGLWLPEEEVSLQGGVEPELAASEGESEVNREPTVGEVEVELSTTEALEVADEPETVQAPESEPVVTTTEPVAAAQPSQLPLSDATPQSVLELEYQADCWSEIEDAAGRNLTYGLIPAGKNIKLRGEAPFKVFLGYASGVTVYYNGVLYDHSPYQRGDVARFRIGRAEHNQPLSGN